MWVAKGLLLGVWLFTFTSIVWLGVAIYRYMAVSRATIPPGRSGEMTPPGFFTGHTVQNVDWWLALVVCVCIALIITHSWSGKPILWIGLAVTELVPVGFVTWVVVHVNQVPGFGFRPYR